MCECEFCEKCVCTHKSDEHMCGDGHCFICICGEFQALVALDEENVEVLLDREFIIKRC